MRYEWATRTANGTVVPSESEDEARWMHKSPLWGSVELLSRPVGEEEWRLVRPPLPKRDDTR